MKALLAAVCLISGTLAATAAEGWMTDWEAAKTKAKAENKPILINLTGSDWCGWCIKLEKTVFSQEKFKQFVADKVVLMEADFPRKKEQPAEVRKQNAELEKKYLNGGYPTVLLLDAEGNKLSGDLGEIKGGVDAHIAKLTELLAGLKK